MKKALVLLLAGFIFYSTAYCQTTFVIEGVPAHYTPLMENIYLAPSINNWNPGDVNYKFTKHSDGRYYLTFKPSVDTTFHFKFTRGDWARVEVDANGADIANRTFSFTSDTMHFTVAQWHDMMIGTNTATANVNILTTVFNIPQLSTTRRIWIYLPSDYYTSNLNYPVLYMMDGQNVFDALYSFAGEWKVDESLVVANPVRDCIVIAVDNGPNRIAEYAPFVDPTYGGGNANKYMDFMVSTLKPFIDSTFRTLPQQEHTGLLGSSLGGLLSLWGGMQYQTVYGRIGAFSPSIWFDNYQMDTYIPTVTHTGFQKIYFTAGTDESSSDNVVNDVNGAVSALSAIGYKSDELKTYVFQGGQHSETYWSQEFPAAYQWLDLWGSATGVKDNMITQTDWSLTKDDSFIRVWLHRSFSSNYTLEMSDELGRVLYTRQMNPQETHIDIPGNLHSGIYFVSMVSAQQTDTRKVSIAR